MKCHKRETWKNDAGNQIAEPLCMYSPSSLKDVVRIIQEAEQERLTVRAVGSGHSWSDVAVGSDYLVLPGDLDKIFKTAGDSLLKGDVNTSMMVEFESGVRIRELNKELDKRGLALPNMGGWDEQTYVGAMSTSTHGSGIEFGPLCDIVQSIDIVSDGGVLYRIEPADGITDRVKYETKYPPAAGQRKLIQDDDWFNAVKVSMGCMGVIYSLILRVREAFYLKEVRTVSTWNKVKEDLKKGDVLKNNCHYEVIINPYEVKGEHRCLVTTRNDTEKPVDLPADKTSRNFFTELLSSVPFAGDAVKAISDLLPDSAPGIIDTSIKSLEDDSYINKSYKVFNIGKVNEVKAYSAEIAFPLKGNRYIDAVDKYLEISRHYQNLGKLYLVSPTALRFVKGSDTFLSPQYGRDTCMMEIITVKGSQGAFLLYERYENEFYHYSGRPHWGQINSLSGSHNFIADMYPKYETWLDVYRQLNKNGTFDSPFSRRMGFARKTFSPE